MQASEYERLDRAEDRLWWSRALRLFLARLLPKARPGQRALDIGCGTGGLLRQLETTNYRTTGIDFSALALALARRRAQGNLARASANELSFRDEAFDLVTCVDLLEIASAQPARVVAEALRVLRPGGRGLFVMAAHQWLLSEHDRAVNSVRRYSLKQMLDLFTGAQIKIRRATYLFFLLFPLIGLRKLINPPKQTSAAISDVRTPIALVNEPLYFVCWMESQLLRVFNLPIGSSVLVMVEKLG